MAHDANLDPVISEALDACRPARFDPERRDWRQPETAALAARLAAQPRLAELRDRLDSLDSAIASTIVAGNTPEKLAERLLSALRAAAPAESNPPGSSPSGSSRANSIRSNGVAPEATVPLAPAAGGVFHGRRRIAGAIAGTLAMAASLAAIWLLRTPQPLGYDQVIADAKWFDASGLAEEWKSATKNPPDAWYSVSRAIAATATEWQMVDRFLGRGGVAFRVRSSRGAAAVLYVVPLKGRQVLEVAGRSPPRRPDITGGKATAAWTDGTRLWVLVVRGGLRDYQSFMHRDYA